MSVKKIKRFAVVVWCALICAGAGSVGAEGGVFRFDILPRPGGKQKKEKIYFAVISQVDIILKWSFQHRDKKCNFPTCLF